MTQILRPSADGLRMTATKAFLSNLLVLCPGSSLEKSPPLPRGVHEGLRFGLEAIVGGWIPAGVYPLGSRFRGNDKGAGMRAGPCTVWYRAGRE